MRHAGAIGNERRKQKKNLHRKGTQTQYTCVKTRTSFRYKTSIYPIIQIPWQYRDRVSQRK